MPKSVAMWALTALMAVGMLTLLPSAAEAG